MDFTIDGYVELIQLLRKNNYSIANYQDSDKYGKCAILRHDVDVDLQQALSMAQIESRYGINSTYFVLLTSNFYNVFSFRSRKMLRKIQDMGHTIGLHFDEMAYPEDAGIPEKIKQDIQKELHILSEVSETDIITFSYHRPTRTILDSNITLQGTINSYGNQFFRQFKYVSDSRMSWREPILDIIDKGFYPQLHILTHPFWYYEKEKCMKEIISEFINRACMERYWNLKENFTDLDDVIGGGGRIHDGCDSSAALFSVAGISGENGKRG